MYIALCQFNPTVGALRTNAERLLEFALEAARQNAALFFSPELALCGYPPKDLVFQADFLAACNAQLKFLSIKTPIPMIVGAPDGRFNAAYWCFDSEVRVIAHKRLLPNYQVFDEQRYFKPGSSSEFYGFEFREQRFGVGICEDAWSETVGYEENPVLDLVQEHKVDVLINITASPFELGKIQERENMFRDLAKRYKKPFLIAGQVGANDGLIFDGGSLVINSQGEIRARALCFREELVVCKL